MTGPGFDPAKFKHDQRALWSTVSRQRSALPPEFAEGAALVNERLFALCGVQPGHRVLDVATGAGVRHWPQPTWWARRTARWVSTWHPRWSPPASEPATGNRSSSPKRRRLPRLPARIVRRRAEPLGSDVLRGPRQHVPVAAPPAGTGRCAGGRGMGPEGSSPTMGLGGKVLTTRVELPVPPPAPRPSSMSDAEAVTTELTAAGFTDVSVTEYLVPFRLASPSGTPTS